MENKHEQTYYVNTLSLSLSLVSSLASIAS